MSDSEKKLTHVDAEGRARMVDVGVKAQTARIAKAKATLRMQPETVDAIRKGSVKKGAVLSTARIAGITGAKKTSDLIPLCHPLSLTSVEVDFEFVSDTEIEVRTEVHAFDRTGVEMEALSACSVAALTVYDMCKAIDRGMELTSLCLTHKSGGKSGDYVRSIDR